MDQFAEATRKHFADLFQRYGEPIICFSLLKSNEKHPRESPIGDEFHITTESLSEPMPREYKIQFEQFDMKSELKVREACIAKLTTMAKRTLARTGLFCCTRRIDDNLCITYQAGVVRTNCIDCIDRTNAAQLAIANVVLEYQLSMMGLFDGLSKKCKIVQLLTSLFEEMGDELARQYAGSAAHQNLRKHNGPSKIFTSIKRHWSNMITDTGKQQAINLILGAYQPTVHQIPLWDIQDDSVLHRIPNYYTAPPKNWWKVHSLRFKRKIGLGEEVVGEGRRKLISGEIEKEELKAGVLPSPQYIRTDLRFQPLLSLPPSSAITSFDRKFDEGTNKAIPISLEADVPEQSESRPRSERVTQAKMKAEFVVSPDEVAAFEEYMHPEKHLKRENFTLNIIPFPDDYIIDIQTLLDQADKPEIFQHSLITEMSGENLLSPVVPGISMSFDSMYGEEPQGGKVISIVEDHFVAPVKVFKEKKRTF